MDATTSRVGRMKDGRGRQYTHTGYLVGMSEGNNHIHR